MRHHSPATAPNLPTTNPKSLTRAPTRELPATGFVRIAGVLAVYPVGRSSWWKGVRQGRYPAAVKLGPRTTAWRVEDIRELLERSADRGTAA